MQEGTTIGEKVKFFPVSSELLSAEHVLAINTAIWVFLWLIDRTTSEKEVDGERWGTVLYGRTIASKQIAADLGVHERVYRGHIKRLEQGGYIKTERKTSGQVIYVKNSIKWQWREQHEPYKPRLGGGDTKSPTSLRPSQIDWEAESKLNW